MKFRKKHLYLLYFFITIIVLHLISCPILLNTIQKINTELSVYNSEYVVTKTSTKSNTVTITTSGTPFLTETQIPNTPTAYPIFHPELIVTVTPTLAEVCPDLPDSEFLDLIEEFDVGNNEHDWLSTAMLTGASPQQIESVFIDEVSQWFRISALDLTTDGVPELIIDHASDGGEIYQCRNQGYVKILDYDTLSWPARLYMDDYDINQNGIPEIMISYYATSGFNLTFDVLEWNGIEIQSKLRVSNGVDAPESSRWARALSWYGVHTMGMEPNTAVMMDGGADIILEDLNDDGLLEIILDGDGPASYDTKWNFGPWLGEKLIFQWNGESFLLSDFKIDEPIHRFQAVQEADRAFLLRDYERASLFYDKVINDADLLPYSWEFMQYLEDVHNQVTLYNGSAEDLSVPEVSLDEYQQLSAYARYRLIMIDLAAGKQDQALNTYQMLYQINIGENPGYAHAVMGRIYWESVEEGMSLVDACQPVKDYVSENLILLEPLGNSGSRVQSHEYTVDDICPLDETDVMLLGGN